MRISPDPPKGFLSTRIFLMGQTRFDLGCNKSTSLGNVETVGLGIPVEEAKESKCK